MTAGLLVKNDNNELLINETYKNLYLFRKLKLTDLPYQELRTGTLAFATPIQADEVIAAIARTNGGALKAFSTRATAWVVYAPRTSSNQTTSQLLAELDDVYVYVFGVNTRPVATGNYGLQVFDKNGVCVYDSNNKPMRVLHYANNVGDPDKMDAELDGYYVPSNKVCAIYNSAIMRVADGTGGLAAVFSVRFLNAYISSNGKVRQQNTLFGGAPFGFVMGDYIGYMVVDVTGY